MSCEQCGQENAVFEKGLKICVQCYRKNLKETKDNINKADFGKLIDNLFNPNAEQGGE